MLFFQFVIFILHMTCRSSVRMLHAKCDVDKTWSTSCPSLRCHL